MIHEILREVYLLVLKGQFPNTVTLSMEHYSMLKYELEKDNDFNKFIDLTIVIKRTSQIHVK